MGNWKGWRKPSGEDAITLNIEWVGVSYLHRGGGSEGVEGGGVGSGR